MESEAGLDEVHVIERVEGLGAELDAMAFPRQLEVLADRYIKVRHRRQAQGSAHSGLAGVLVGERIHNIGIGEQARIAVAIDAQLLTDGPGHDAERILPVVGVPGVIPLHHAREARAVAHDAGYLPAADDLVHPGGGAAQEFLVAAAWKLADHACVDVVAQVEIGRAAELVRSLYTLDD